ncbi:MAG: D-alanyl-D-alanine carboxypeptidase [Clostridia bacterium]|nr:D-alanyl-D-alanine carboxypeptidase [Clostridia bacterium]
MLLVFVFVVNVSVKSYASPDVSARSAIVIENTTGRVLYEKNSKEKLPMASTTKIMTALCAIENSQTWKAVKVDDRAVGIEGSSVYLTHGEVITMEELIYATMLNSGNDAATAIAYEISGSVEGFAKLMNSTAKKIGAKNTNFVNACGLWEKEHYTTAHDLALISAYALKNPTFAKIVSTKKKTISNGDKDYDRILSNHNKLLSSYPGCIGVKTGYTKKCGRCLVSAARRDGVTLTCVTLNAPDDWNDHKNLLDNGFSKVKSVIVAKSGDYAASVCVKNGMQKTCPLEFSNDLSSLEFFEKETNANLRFKLPQTIEAPIMAGESIGMAEVVIDGKIVASVGLVSSVSVAQKPMVKRSVFWENIKKYLKF